MDTSRLVAVLHNSANNMIMINNGKKKAVKGLNKPHIYSRELGNI